MKKTRMWIGTLVGISTLLFSLTSFAQTACQLNESCSVPDATELMTIPVRESLGTDYTCRLTALKKNAKITITLQGANGYDSPLVFLTAYSNGARINLKGKFTKPNGVIVVQEFDNHHTLGHIFCRTVS